MILSPMGAEVMVLNVEFEEDYAPFMGWENPFDRDLKLEQLSINENRWWRPQGFPEERLTTREEKDLWILRRDRYIMKGLLRRFSYEEVKEWVKKSYCAERLLEELSQKAPCEIGDGQCSFDCIKFGTCGKED